MTMSDFTIDLSGADALKALKAFQAGAAHGHLLSDVESLRTRIKFMQGNLSSFAVTEDLRLLGRSIYRHLEFLQATIEQIDAELLLKRPPASDVDAKLSDIDLADVGDAMARGETNFTSQLLRLIAKADPSHRARIRRVYPEVVDAYEKWFHSKETSNV
jgi:hypothetical protein